MSMESSTQEDEKLRRRVEESNFSPCYLFQKLVKSLLNCLPFYDSTTLDQPPPQPESGMKIKEDTQIQTADRSLIKLAKRPSRPPVSSGGGGQIN